jgi:hypothetical protein
MQIDFFGSSVRCDTEERMISLTDLARAGNQWRAVNKLAIKPLAQVLESVGFTEFKKVAEKELPGVELIRVEGKGSTKRTMGHVTLAVYLAEQYSPEFHFHVINTFIEGKIMEFREYGGTEFKALNAAIDSYLPGREGKDSNKGIYINAAKLLRDKILGPEAKTESWNAASVAQTHARYEAENKLTYSLRMGHIRDWDHLKETIAKL